MGFWVVFYYYFLNGDNSYKIEYGQKVIQASVIDRSQGNLKFQDHWVERKKSQVKYWVGEWKFLLRKKVNGRILDEAKI